MTELPVLMYHSVGGAMPPGLDGLSVPPGLLAEQLAALREAGWELLGLTDALRAQQEGRRAVALTFDDGYLDFTTAGLAVLSAAGAGATLYLPTRDLGGRASWLPGADQPRLVGQAEVGEVVAAGVEVGSHGAVHVPLDVLPPARAAAELAESRLCLEDLTGRPVRSFCYPHGYHSRPLRRRVRAAGYDSACAIGHRTHPASEDRYAVSRLLVGPSDGPHTLLGRLAGRPGWRPATVATARRAAGPGWRAARLVALRTAGVTWT